MNKKGNMKISFQQLQPYIDANLIKVNPHPTANLFICNYTPECQFDRKWDPITLMCRGLVVDDQGNVVARPFDKFFNHTEIDRLPDGEYEVFEKLDGSLGITYWIDNEVFLTTRGCFTSPQALKGTELLRKIKLELKPEYTYLFEIIYPENRIVVNYGDEERLVLLGVIETSSGKEFDLDQFDYPFKPIKYDSNSIDELLNKNLSNAEGFVLKYKTGERVKVKFEEYKRLHRIITGLNERAIWEMLKDNQKIPLEGVPDEFYKWCNSVIEDFTFKFNDIKVRAEKALVEGDLFNKTRKEAALWIMKDNKDIAGVIFCLLDRKNVEEVIWKKLRV